LVKTIATADFVTGLAAVVREQFQADYLLLLCRGTAEAVASCSKTG
jgi:hypothetical protein